MADKELFKEIQLFFQSINAILEFSILGSELLNFIQRTLGAQSSPRSTLFHSLIVPLPVIKNLVIYSEFITI